MKKISLICFSLTGQQTGERLLAGLLAAGYEASLYRKSRYLPDSIEESTAQWTGARFADSDGIVFLGACGIAVRSIAPYVAKKTSDPAVLVIDECGKYAISLLSGHLGGANELTQKAAGILQAVPVVTTATDLHQQFAVDVFAKKSGCRIFHMKAAKAVSAALLAGEKVGFYSEFSVEGQLPKGLILCDEKGYPKEEATVCGEEFSTPLSTGIAVTIHTDCLPFEETTQLVPGIVALGMGCRKNKDPKEVKEAADACLREGHLYAECVEYLASIDVKKQEPGLLFLAKEWGIPFLTYSKEELLLVSGEFTASSFVKGTVGVENVCERSAVLASGQGTLIQKKTAAQGVTTALAVRNWRIHF